MRANDEGRLEARSPLSIVQEARDFVRSADLKLPAHRGIRSSCVSLENSTLELCHANSAASIATTCPSLTSISRTAVSSLGFGRSLEPLRSFRKTESEDICAGAERTERSRKSTSTRKLMKKSSQRSAMESLQLESTAEPSELERQCSVTSAVSAVSVGSRESESRGSLNGIMEADVADSGELDTDFGEVIHPGGRSGQLSLALKRLKELAKNKSKGRRKERREKEKDCEERLKLQVEASRTVEPRSVSIKGGSFTWVRGELLGRGSLGSVWKATDKKTGQVMAVKEVIIDHLDDSDKDFSQSLEVEIDLYKQLKHPNIVRYLGNDRVKDRFYIYLEYMQGGSVSQVLHREGPMPESLIACYAAQLLEGLNYLHTREPLILHRDVKGGNILVGEKRSVKLSDFGCSKRSEETCKHTLRGSIPWMAPEVMNERAYGRKADVWSLGCVFIEMITAKPPWGLMHNPLATMVRVATSEETPPVNVPISDAFRDIITSCTRRDPEERLLASELLDHPFLALAEIDEST